MRIEYAYGPWKENALTLPYTVYYCPLFGIPSCQGEVKNAFVVKERWRRTPNSLEVTIDG